MELLKENERSAEKAAAKVMRITAIVFTLVLILDIVGIFTVKLGTMIAAFVIGTVLLLIPTLIVNVRKASGTWVKYAIAICSVLFSMVITITLAYHAVLIFIYPIAIASLFFSSRLNTVTTIITIIGVSIGQYVCFCLQLVKDDNFSSLKSLLLFGIVPRALILVAISAIFTMLCKRTTNMLGSLMGAEQQRIMREKSLEISEKLLGNVEDLEKIAGSSAEANLSISEESSNVMRDSDENFQHIKYVENSMSDISDALNKLSEMSLSIAELTKKADGITAVNSRKIAEASKSMDEICRGSDESREIISRLSDQSAKIVEIAKVITGISTQTNILAINASIEASRAGEAGRGFSVVAGEIKSLSDKTKTAAAEIGVIISQVTENIAGTVTAIERSADLTRQGMESMEQMRRSAEQLNSSNAEISQNISGMTGVIADVTASGSNVSAKLADVSRNIERNCGAVQHVAAAIQENSAGTENLRSMVGDIKIMSEELKKLAE